MSKESAVGADLERRPRATAMDEADVAHLRRCIELARTTREDGNEPFGSLLVDGDGTVLVELTNPTGNGDVTGHPELGLAAWASVNLTAGNVRLPRSLHEL